MHWALEDGAYRAFGYICMGSISYDPIPNGGEGALGQGNCASAIEDVMDTVIDSVIDIVIDSVIDTCDRHCDRH